MIVLAVVWLYLTTPSRDACVGQCSPCSNPSAPLEVALVSSTGDTLARHPAAAPGFQDSLSFDWAGESITVYALSRGPGGWSCLSNPIQMGSVSVPPPVGEVADGYYDLTGRRVNPSKSGIYFTKSRKTIVVR